VETNPSEQTTPPGRRRAWILKLTLSLVVFGLAALLLDRALLWLGFPTDRPRRVAHEPDIEQTFKNLEFTWVRKTNSMGLRNPEIPLEKPAGEFRVVVCGDSFAEGYGVAAEACFTSRLNTLFSGRDKIRFVNCGFEGTGPIDYARSLFMVGRQYGPDVVILTIYGNDLDSLPGEGGLDVRRNDEGSYEFIKQGELPEPRGFAKRAFKALLPWTYAKLRAVILRKHHDRLRALPIDEAVAIEAEIKGIARERVEEWRRSIPPELLQAAREGRFNGHNFADGCLDPGALVGLIEVGNERAKRQWKVMDRVLTQTAGYCRADGIRLVVVWAPLPFQHDSTILPYYRKIGMVVRKEWLTGEAEIERRLGAWAVREKIPFLSLTETFRAACNQAPGKYNYRLDGHWNPAGHSLAAGTIAEWLRRQSLVPAVGED